MRKWISRRPAAALLVSCCMLAAGCAATGTQTKRSANQNSRVSIIVIHHTTSNFAESLKLLTEPSDRPVSSHYLIPEPGDETYGRSRVRTYALVPETRRAWHAGDSYWGGKTGINDQSIGIELVNRTWCHDADTDVDGHADVGSQGTPRLCFYPDFAESQIAALIELLEGILERHPGIAATNIVGHADVAPGRKIDPGPRFPWQRLAALGYGAWYDDDVAARYWERFRREPLPLVNLQRALDAYGYGIEATGLADEQTRDVVRAFQMHFRPSEVSGEMTAESAAVLFALVEKYFPDRVEELLRVEDDETSDPPEPPRPATPAR